MRSPRSLSARSLFIILVLGLAACGGSADKGTSGTAVTPPSRSGDVWEIQSAEDRTTVPGSIVAFVNGVHVMVVNGDRIYAGMTELSAKSGSNGAQTISFPSGLTADLMPGTQGTELRFSSGERLMVRERE